MKLSKLFSLAIGVVLTFSVTTKSVVAQNNSGKPKMVYIIEDAFFYKLPVNGDAMAGGYFVETLNGTKAMVVTLNRPLTSEEMKEAVSPDLIPEAEELKQRYAEAQMRQNLVNGGERLQVGDKFPEFSATDIEGKVWTNADVAGKPMVLNQWYTGCKPCRTEMPELSEWKVEMPDVMFFSVTYEDAQRAQPALDQAGFNWTHLVNDKQFVGWIGDQGYPMTIVIDKDGIVRHIEYGTSPEKRASLKEHIKAVR